MIRLNGVRLIHWYHFADETFRLQGSCLLLGDNGSGKSTILDAIQFGLVADQTQVRFNKAANENSRRTLYGYVRWKLGSEDEKRPGQVLYGRGGCTSYILLEFSDDRAASPPFVAGLACEAGESDSQVSRWHFVLPGLRLDEVPARAGNLIRTAREFRAEVRGLPQARIFPDASTYREEIRHRLGALPEAFHRLLVKSLEFRPIGSIREFVFQYLLDEQPVDTAALQQNLEHYKKLEAQSVDAERRLSALDAICEAGERIAQERRTADSHRYLACRAGVEIAENWTASIIESIGRASLELESLEAEIRRLDEQLVFLGRERDRLAGLLHGMPGYAEIRSLERDIERLEVEIQEARDSDARARRILDGQAAALDLLLASEARDLRRRRPELFDPEDLTGLAEEPPILGRLRGTLVREGSLEGRDLRTWTLRLEHAVDAIRMANLRLQKVLDEAKEEGRALQAEQQDLERGRKKYPDGAEALLHLLRAKLRGSREPRPFCELIEVKNPRWQDAVEGYLNTRRFDVIIAPEDFQRALGLYEKNKRGYHLPGRGEVFISRVGLVDVERVLSSHRTALRRSLAEQVETDDPLARAYADYLLGEIICCDSEDELRSHRSAITDTVMVYRNHAARQTPREDYSRHFIGEAARLRRLDEIARRLAELAQSVLEFAGDIRWLGQAASSTSKARNEVIELPRLVEEAGRLGNLEGHVQGLRRQLAGIDRHEIQKLEEERVAVERASADATGEKSGLLQKLGGKQEGLRRLGTEEVQAADALRAARLEIETAFSPAGDERRRSYEERYLKERAERAAREIREIFERQFRTISSRVENLVQELVQKKTEYSNSHGFAGTVLGEDYKDFDEERGLWRESRLPEYRDRIRRAREEAIQQLAEDIIFRLRENLVGVRRQVDELNFALKDVPFGTDRYQFTLDVSPEHRDFYDLIMDAGRFEKDSLFGSAALSDSGTRKTLEDLFERLTESEASQVKSDLEARADYREYFRYDLRIQHADGSHSFYDRVAADKSGGETQNPFYIAIFASLYRLYRRLAPEGRPTFGLVLLDEAFSKMDESRIASTLRFARDLGLQLILATPKERSELVATRVETSLLIHKDPLSGTPTVLDFSKEFAGEAEDRSAGAEEAVA